MPPSTITGPTVPGWIREQVGLHERAWPLVFLGFAVALSIVIAILLGVLIWTASPAVYYARP